MKQRLITWIQIIRCFFWKLKNRLVFKIKTSRKVIDASDLYRIKYLLYVEKDGALMFQTHAMTSHIIGICEWKKESKRLSRIDEKKIVLDMLGKPIDYAGQE